MPSTGTLATSAGSVSFSNKCLTWRRCCGVSMNPPVPGVEASRKLSCETTCAFPAVPITWFRVTLRLRKT